MAENTNVREVLACFALLTLTCVNLNRTENFIEKTEITEDERLLRLLQRIKQKYCQPVLLRMRMLTKRYVASKDAEAKEWCPKRREVTVSKT